MPEQFFYKQTTLPTGPATQSSTPPVPEKIGPYRIESLFIKGGMSLLYLGLHPETRQPLIIKVLSPDYVNHPEMTERFLKETHIIGMTNHPNIVKLYGEGKWEGGLYIAMEFIKGISLRQFIIQKSLSLKRTLDIVLQVSHALLHLHTHGVIHRDLKPENILITEEGEIKVIDFGIAQLHDEIETEKGTNRRWMGTPSYMSPEQKEDPMRVSFSSDIYALGIIAYELVLGKLSFGVINLSLLPRGLQKIIGKALAVSPKERYQDVVEFINDISQYLKSGDVEKERPGTDQLKEAVENVQRAEQALSPTTLPDWQQMDIGLVKSRLPNQIGLYYDLFKFPNNTYALLIAQPLASGVEAAPYIASLRGSITALLKQRFQDPKSTFSLSGFATQLNQLVCEDKMRQQFAFSMLLLNPLREELSFISCGLPSLIHVPVGSQAPRKLSSINPPLGVDPVAAFVEMSDTWNLSDHLFFHSLEVPGSQEAIQGNGLEKKLLEAITDSLLLSPQRQAETILKKISGLPAFASNRHPTLLFCIQRVG